MEIGHLSIKQLDALALAIAERRQQLVYSDRKRVRQLLRDEAAKEGFTIEELFRFGAPDSLQEHGSQRTTKANTQTASRGTTYRNPMNPDQVWRGRGPRPRWMNRAFAAGMTIDMLRVVD